MPRTKAGPKGPKNEGSYTEYFTSTNAPKLKKSVNIKESIAEEVNLRHTMR